MQDLERQLLILKIDQKDAKNRLIIFQGIAEKIKKDYRDGLIKKTVKVLFENKIKNENKYFGRDEYFNSVIVESDNDLTGKIKDIRILNEIETPYTEKLLKY